MYIVQVWKYLQDFFKNVFVSLPNYIGNLCLTKSWITLFLSESIYMCKAILQWTFTQEMITLIGSVWNFEKDGMRSIKLPNTFWRRTVFLVNNDQRLDLQWWHWNWVTFSSKMNKIWLNDPPSSQVQGLVKAQQIHASFFQRLQALISVAFYGKRKYPSMVFQQLRLKRLNISNFLVKIVRSSTFFLRSFFCAALFTKIISQ